MRERFGAFARGIAHGLARRHDHGSQYVSHHFQAEVLPERFIRQLKENLLWIRRFATIEELRLVLLAFQQTYNQRWIIERHGYRTPAQVRTDQIGQLLMAA